MKKFLSILLVCGLVLMLGACFNSDIMDAHNELESKADEVFNGNGDLSDLDSSLEDYANAIDGNIKGYDDINEYIKISTESEAFKQTLNTLADSGMTLELLADSNNLIYRYTYTVEVVAEAADLLEQSFIDNDSTLQLSADTIRIEAPCVENVIFEYYSVDGELLASLTK